MNFFATTSGQYLAGAHGYLRGAKLLRFSNQWEDEAALIQKPVLHLLCHGLELLLKYSLVSSGMNAKDVRRQYGHDLAELWKADANARLRFLAERRAQEAWAEAKVSAKWQDDEFEDDPGKVLSDAIEQLSWLHGAKSDFALRYLVPPNTPAPRPAFLLDVFEWISDHAITNAAYLEGSG